MSSKEDAYDRLETHLAAAGDMARASVPMGMLLAWCTNMQLLSPVVLREHERLILRLRFQEAQGSELLIACGGDLSRELFNAEGQRFLDRYYPGYMSVFQQVFGEDCYTVQDNWNNYRNLAAVLTEAYMTGARSSPKRRKPQSGEGMLKKIANWWKR